MCVWSLKSVTVHWLQGGENKLVRCHTTVTFSPLQVMFTLVRMMRIYFPIINQSPKPKKYMAMNFSYDQLVLLTTYKIFSLAITNLPGLDFQAEVRSDFSWVFSYLLGVQLLHRYIVWDICTGVHVPNGLCSQFGNHI